MYRNKEPLHHEDSRMLEQTVSTDRRADKVRLLTQQSSTEQLDWIGMSAGYFSDLMLLEGVRGWGGQTVETTDNLAVGVLIYSMKFSKNKVNK